MNEKPLRENKPVLEVGQGTLKYPRVIGNHAHILSCQQERQRRVLVATVRRLVAARVVLGQEAEGDSGNGDEGDKDPGKP